MTSDLLEGGSFSVLEGRDGWLFLDSYHDDDVMGIYTGTNPVPSSTYDAWVRVLRHRQHWFAERGIPYLTFVVPDACRVYPDKLPSSLTLTEDSPGTLLRDRLDASLADQYLYTLDELVAARDQHPTFQRTDTHWTDWGAFVGYRAVMAALSPRVRGLRVLEEDDVTWSRRTVFGALGVRLNDERSEEVRAAEVTDSRCSIVRNVLTEVRDGYLVVEQDRPELPTAVVFRDSFMTAAHKFFSESFRRVSYVTQPNLVFYDLLEQERPDVVITEIAERRLTRPPDEPSLFDFRSMFGDLLMDDPEAVAAQVESRSLLTLGDTIGALRANTIAVVHEPNARLMMHRSRLHTILRRPAAALESLRTATSLDPGDGLAWYVLGLTLRSRGHAVEAFAAARRAAEVEPDRAPFWTFAVSAAIGAGDPGPAIRVAREGLRLHPEHAALHYAYSHALVAAGALFDADTAARRALVLDPGSRPYARQLVSVLIRRRAWQQAADALAGIAEDGGEEGDPLEEFRDLVARHLDNGTLGQET